MTNREKTAEQLRACREAFEKWISDYGRPIPETTLGLYMRNAWQAAWNTRADSGEAVAWLHIMHMEHGQTARLLTESSTNPWGTRGKHYDESYAVTSVPLFTHPSATALDVLDAARLDFLDACNIPMKMGWRVVKAPMGNVTVQSVIQLGVGVTSIRQAIDAALSQRVEK